MSIYAPRKLINLVMIGLFLSVIYPAPASPQGEATESPTAGPPTSEQPAAGPSTPGAPAAATPDLPEGEQSGATPDQPPAATGTATAASSPANGSGQTEITGIELRRDKELLKLHFILSGSASSDVVENIRKKVIVVKFQNTRTAFLDGKDQFAFNDALVEGIRFETVNSSDSWAKIRLRNTNLAYQEVKSPPPNHFVLSFRQLPPQPKSKVMKVRLGRYQEASRVVVDLNRVVEYESRRQGNQYLVRMIGVTPGLEKPLQGEDDQISLLSLEKDGEDSLLRIGIKKRGLLPVPLVLTDPPRLVFTFREVARLAGLEETGEKPVKATDRVDPVNALLAGEKSALLRANYVRGEKEFRMGKYRTASGIFMRVFRSKPESRLGIRAYFRAADAQYELLKSQKSKGYHGVIINYQSAVRAAESAGFDSDIIPRAFFRVGRAYQLMTFNYEANVHYNILQDRFPNNDPYTTDSYYFQGWALLGMKKYEESISSFRKFLEREGDKSLVAPAYYSLGDALYQLKRYPEAKVEFDRGRRTDGEYPNSQPLLLFHMGETYYENAEFDVARVLYNNLLERYPGKPYTKLVGLRLGDFLREEGKETDALRVYQGVIEGAPLEIQLRGKIRIADIYASHPTGDGYKKAIVLYDEVIKEGKRTPIVEEASLRKTLVLTLHNQNREAITALIKLVETYPKNRYVRYGHVNSNILENIKALVDQLFEAKKYWEVAKVYTKFRDPYFRNFPFNISMFQVARSYHILGLYEEALILYNRTLKSNQGALASLINYQIAVAYGDKDDLGKAEEALLKFIRGHPKDRYLTDARLQLGKVYLEGRRYQDALNAYLIIIQDFEQTGDAVLAEALPEAHYHLGKIYKELGQLKESLDSFRATVENFNHPLQGKSIPEFIVLAHFLTGDVLYELNQDQEAIAAYETAIARYPKHNKTPWARFQIGLVLRRNGEEREALKIFNELVELAKTQPGELWETLAQENQRDLVNSLGYQDYLKQ